MTFTIWKRAALLTVLCVTALIANANTMRPPPFSQLAGVWQFDGLPEPTCGVAPFQNLGSISRDGRITNVDPDLGTGVGDSYWIAPGTYAVGFFGYIKTPGPLLRYEVQSTATVVDKGRFDAVFRVIVTDLQGSVQCTYNGTLNATRLLVQPF